MKNRIATSRLLSAVLGLALAACMASVSATTVLDTKVNVDNEFKIYLSTNPDSIAGATLVENGLGTSWGTTYTASAAITGTEYLIVEAINEGGPGGFEGSFSLSGTNYQFENGTQALATGSSNWTQLLASASGTVVDPALSGTFSNVWNEGANGVGPWGTQSAYSGLAVQPDWIWNSSETGTGTVYFETEISAAHAVPEPGTCALIGLGLLAALFRSRKSKQI